MLQATTLAAIYESNDIVLLVPTEGNVCEALDFCGFPRRVHYCVIAVYDARETNLHSYLQVICTSCATFNYCVSAIAAFIDINSNKH